MKTSRILFLISRTHGLMAHLLKTQDYIRLLETRDLRGMVDFLSAMDYSSELSLVPTSEITALKLERVFYEKLSKRWYSLLAMSSGKIRELLEAHNARLEIENLKKLIRAVHGKESITADVLIDVPRKYQNLNFRALSAAKSMIEIVDLLKETPYKDAGQWLGEYETYNNPLILEAQLDKVYYMNLWTKANKKADGYKIRELIGTEADLRNLQLIVSAKYTKLEPRLIRRMIVDLGHRLQRSVTSRLANVDLQGIPGTVLWPSYSELMRRAVELVNEDRLVEMETLLSLYTYSYVEKMAVRNPNSLVYVFSYLSLYSREAKNLTTLAIGKQTKIGRESLRSLVLF